MVKTLLLIIVMTLIAVPVFAADKCETITVTNTSIGFTAGNITNPANGFKANIADCVLATGQIRFWVDGTEPTTTTGVLVEVGQGISLDKRNDVQMFKAIRTGATSGVLSCCYN